LRQQAGGSLQIGRGMFVPDRHVASLLATMVGAALLATTVGAAPPRDDGAALLATTAVRHKVAV
ncbi:MAG: hypothetical protein U5K38_13245, partial [Woeseiaceae bacterium]|nr:hypothetical protein [Woeseiaceae bacterium]